LWKQIRGYFKVSDPSREIGTKPRQVEEVRK
jgi:hypothetical protein